MSEADRERPAPAVTYRLPDWLGGHKVVLTGVDMPGDLVHYETAEEIDGELRHGWIERRNLVEVRPPSIDDPVTLPLVFAETSDQYEFTAWAGAGDLACVRVGKDGKVRELAPSEALDAARALWKIGTAPSTEAGA